MIDTKIPNIKKTNSDRRIRTLAAEMRTHFMTIPWSGGKTMTETRYLRTKNTPEWVTKICQECEIGRYESIITNRFICEVLDILIAHTHLVITQTHRHIHADFYLISILKWLAEDELHLEYVTYAHARFRLSSIPKIIKEAQLIRKQEIAKTIVKMLQQTKGI